MDTSVDLTKAITSLVVLRDAMMQGKFTDDRPPRALPFYPALNAGAASRAENEPLRLSVMIEAPREEILTVLEKHPGVRALFDNGWLHLIGLKEGRMTKRYRPGLAWEAVTP